MSLARVITVSDRSSRGEREDRSGPEAVRLLAEAGFEADCVVVPDGARSVASAIRDAMTSGARLVLTTGGTGLAPRDQTPEGTLSLGGREVPGIAELLRLRGLEHSSHAALSRGVAVQCGDALVVNLPGSPRAVTQSLEVLLPLVPHVLDQILGGDH